MPPKNNVIALPTSVDEVEFDRPPGLPETCSNDELLQAVKAQLCGATQEELARLLHVPVIGVSHWVNSREWSLLKQHVLPEMKGGVHGELMGVRSLLIRQLAQRVREGDPQYNQLGEFLGFRPVKARDLSTMLVQSSEVLHNLELEIGVIRDEKNHISLDNLVVALQKYAKEEPQDITGNSERVD
jgi:hypothetical protein